MAIFTGAGVAIATPFNKDGSVNHPEFDRLIDFQIGEGTDAIIVCGTTGESATMSEEEHVDVIRDCIKMVNHRVPVIAGAGSNCTETAVKLSKEAEELGADGILSVTPYYNKATQAGLIAHFGAVAEAVKLPIILYDVPGRTGCTLQPETIATLVKKYDNIVGIKDATGDLAHSALALQLCDGNLDVYAGNDDVIVPTMSVGGKGVISVLSNIAPGQTHDMVMKCLEGDYVTAGKMQCEAMPLIKALFVEVNPIPVKKALEFIGFGGTALRLPLTEMTEANAKLLKQTMQDYGLKVK